MHTGFHRYRVPMGASAPSAVADPWMDERRQDLARVVVRYAEMRLVARFGPAVPGGVDVRARGVRQQFHRKLIRGGQRTVFARLHPGRHAAVLGVPASELAGRVVALEDPSGGIAAQRLRDRLARFRRLPPS